MSLLYPCFIQRTFAMNGNRIGPQPGGTPALFGEEEFARLREELHEAIRAQEQLQRELRAALSELSKTLSRTGATAAGRFDSEYPSLERRLSTLERDVNAVSQGVESILHSRIWRALVTAGGLLLGFRRSAAPK